MQCDVSVISLYKLVKNIISIKRCHVILGLNPVNNTELDMTWLQLLKGYKYLTDL